MTEIDGYVIRENPSHRMDATELRTSIHNIMVSEGMKVPSYMCAADTSSAYLPPMEIASADKMVIMKKKEAELAKGQPPSTESLQLDGGVRGLLSRADTNHDNRLSPDEITSRLGAKLSKDEAIALKDVYRNFSSMDWDGNGRVSRGDIEAVQRREHTEEQLNDRLDAFRRIVATRRQDIDTNHDSQIGAGELARATQSNSGFSRQDRETINWIRSRT